MGTWGTALFSDDTASDVREDFRELIGDGVDVETATARMIEEWRPGADPDEASTFWLALAATQWQLGRLLPDVCSRAIEIIDAGLDLTRWRDSREVSKRERVLVALRAKLLSPQPVAKRVPRRFRSTNDWPLGSLHAYELRSRELCVFRVIGHHTDKGGTAPVVEMLDWIGSSVPRLEVLNDLPVRIRTYPNGHRVSARFARGPRARARCFHRAVAARRRFLRVSLEISRSAARGNLRGRRQCRLTTHWFRLARAKRLCSRHRVGVRRPRQWSAMELWAWLWILLIAILTLGGAVDLLRGPKPLWYAVLSAIAGAICALLVAAYFDILRYSGSAIILVLISLAAGLWFVYETVVDVREEWNAGRSNTELVVVGVGVSVVFLSAVCLGLVHAWRMLHKAF
jgi:hypothetical protein